MKKVYNDVELEYNPRKYKVANKLFFGKTYPMLVAKDDSHTIGGLSDIKKIHFATESKLIIISDLFTGNLNHLLEIKEVSGNSVCNCFSYFAQSYKKMNDEEIYLIEGQKMMEGYGQAYNALRQQCLKFIEGCHVDENSLKQTNTYLYNVKTGAELQYPFTSLGNVIRIGNQKAIEANIRISTEYVSDNLTVLLRAKDFYPLAIYSALQQRIIPIMSEVEASELMSNPTSEKRIQSTVLQCKTELNKASNYLEELRKDEYQQEQAVKEEKLSRYFKPIK